MSDGPRMSNADFRAWRERRYPSRHAAAIALDLHRETVAALEEGRTRKGGAYPVPEYIALACLAVDYGLDAGRSETELLAGTLRRAAEWIEHAMIPTAQEV